MMPGAKVGWNSLPPARQRSISFSPLRQRCERGLSSLAGASFDSTLGRSRSRCSKWKSRTRCQSIPRCFCSARTQNWSFPLASIGIHRSAGAQERARQNWSRIASAATALHIGADGQTGSLVYRQLGPARVDFPGSDTWPASTCIEAPRQKT